MADCTADDDDDEMKATAICRRPQLSRHTAEHSVSGAGFHSENALSPPKSGH